MITIPIKSLCPQGNADLAILCEALFMEFEDNRLISTLCADTIEDRVEILRESPVCEVLYNMINIFGEYDFIKAVTPCLNTLAKEDYDTDEYLNKFEECFKEYM
jgi:hypothetical protein